MKNESAVAIGIQQADFDVGFELAQLRAAGSEIGAIASFVGVVSALNDDRRVTGLRLEHYPGMTERSIADIIDEAQQRWPLQAVRVIHRIGELRLREQIVFVGVASRHRGAAFAACEFIMDFLKTRAPFWKKETTADGEHWVQARASDDDAAARWQR